MVQKENILKRASKTNTKTHKTASCHTADISPSSHYYGKIIIKIGGENLYTIEKYTYICRATCMNFVVKRVRHGHNLLQTSILCPYCLRQTLIPNSNIQ